MYGGLNSHPYRMLERYQFLFWSASDEQGEFFLRSGESEGLYSLRLGLLFSPLKGKCLHGEETNKDSDILYFRELL